MFALRQKFECLSVVTSASNAGNNIYSEVYSSPTPVKKKHRAPSPPTQNSSAKLPTFIKNNTKTKAPISSNIKINEGVKNRNDSPIYKDELNDSNPIYSSELPVETKVEKFLQSQEEYCNGINNNSDFDDKSTVKELSLNDFNEKEPHDQVYCEAKDYTKEVNSEYIDEREGEKITDEVEYGTIDDDQLYATTIPSELTRTTSCESIHPPPDYIAPVPPPPPLPVCIYLLLE